MHVKQCHLGCRCRRILCCTWFLLSPQFSPSSLCIKLYRDENAICFLNFKDTEAVPYWTNKQNILCLYVPLFTFLKSDLWPKYLTCDNKSFNPFCNKARCNPGLNISASSSVHRYHWKQWGTYCLNKIALFMVHKTMNWVELNAMTYTVICNSNNSLFGDFCLGNKPAVAIQRPQEGLGCPPPSPLPQAVSVYRGYQLWVNYGGFFRLFVLNWLQLKYMHKTKQNILLLYVKVENTGILSNSAVSKQFPLAAEIVKTV